MSFPKLQSPASKRVTSHYVVRPFIVRPFIVGPLVVGAFVGGLVAALAPGPSHAAEPASGPKTSDVDFEFFEKHIRPVLVEHCYECHAADSKNIRGELLLDSRKASQRGGESGPAVVPGNPDESLLLAALRHESFEMPPDRKLPQEVIAKFEKWIADGAADPRDGGASVQRREIDLNVGRQFWSFRPIQKPHPPAVEDSHWPDSVIDQFVLAQIESHPSDLKPNPPADAATRLRRAKFDLVGLPPTPSEIQDFLSDPSDVAFARFVDTWLNTRHFGERWGRHWMDVARFAESSGGGRSLMFPHAWRYRDYVIDAFTNDVPFDQFVREQIAGDLLIANDQATRDRYATATGFLALGPTNYELQDKDLLEIEVVDEQIDTIGRAFLGLTLGCVRCHDHKFDPIPMTDYYALAGIFTSTETVVHSNVSSYVKTTLKSDPAYARYAAADEHLAALKTRQASLAKSRDKTNKALQVAKSKALPSGDHRLVDDAQVQLTGKQLALVSQKRKELESINSRLSELQTQIKAAQKARGEKPIAMSTRDRPQTRDTSLRIRGEIRNVGKPVPRGFVSVACPPFFDDGRPSQLVLGGSESGRLQLANWIASPQNPLTARVLVNRFWHFLMGEGIVRTPDNFGIMGRAPSHPELLNYLAADFIDSGWSVKHLIRQIMLSRVYQMDSQPSEVAGQRDPDNEYFTHANRRRLDAEAIRDSILQVSGQLEDFNGGRTIRKLAEYDLDYEYDTRKRSVYVPRFRNEIMDIFHLFDVANPNLATGRRPSSVLSTQALYVMNGEFVNAQARHAAERLLRLDIPDNERLETAFLMSLGRRSTEREHPLMAEILSSTDEATTNWTEIVHLLFGSVDFRYLH